jgi:hypothetical protein
MSRQLPLASLAALTLLAACANHTQVGSAYLLPAYNPSELGYAGGGRDMEVVVYGNPFAPGMEDPVFAEQMAEAMRGQHFGQDINFTTHPDDSAREGYRIVMAFSPKPAVSGRQMCRFAATGEKAVTSESSGSIPVKMAFCNGANLLSEVPAHLGGGPGVTVESAAELVAQMTPVLLPPTNPALEDPLDSDYDPF